MCTSYTHFRNDNPQNSGHFIVENLCKNIHNGFIADFSRVATIINTSKPLRTRFNFMIPSCQYDNWRIGYHRKDSSMIAIGNNNLS